MDEWPRVTDLPRPSSDTRRPESRLDAERPQYVRIGDLLRDRIRAGKYPVGALLPTEGELCEEFSISRHTVRDALRRLIEAGLIQRRQGSGSRVLATEPHQNYVHAMRSLDQLFQYASDTRFIIGSMKMAQPGRSFFPGMDEFSGQDWLIISGLRLEADADLPICQSTVLVNGRFAEIADTLATYRGAIYQLIEERFGIEVSVVVQDITVTQMPADAASALGEKPRTTAVRVARRYLDAAGTTLLASVNFHPADRFSYSMQLKRDDRRGVSV